MANTFQDQANERFDKATAFLNSSRSLLRNDLIYVSALADAVSAIKNMLQGYLYTQIAQRPPGSAPQSWQEAAVGGGMPDLLRASAEAGLRLPNLLGPRINQLNRDRNARTHDSPKRLIDYARAQEAISLAEEVRRSIRAALGAAPAPSASAPAAVAAAPAAPVPSVPHAPFAPTVAPVPRAPAPAMPAPAATLGGDEPDESDEDVSPASPRRISGWRRFTRALGRIAAVLLLLLVGLAAGVGVMIPVASGNAPSWLNFATRLLPTPSAAMTTPTPAPTATPLSGPIILGVVTVSAPACGVGGSSFQLHNTGTEPVQWAVGSPGSAAPVFTLAAGETPQVTLFGTLASASEVTVYASGTQPVVLTTQGGAVQLTLPAC